MLDEANRPFGLSLGERRAWNDLEIKRLPMNSASWRYVVLDGALSYDVHVHDSLAVRHNIMVQGRRKHALRNGFYARQTDAKAASPGEALVFTLGRVQEMSHRRRETS